MTEFPKDSLTRYYHLVKLCEGIIQEIDNEFKNDKRWFIFSLKVALKLTTHCKSLCLLGADTYFEEWNNKNFEKNIFLDVPGIFANVRVLIDTYSTLHHIFFDDVDWELKRLRFDLWRYDSHTNRIQLNVDHPTDFEQIENLKLSIEENSEFKKLDLNKQKLVFNHSKQSANWKFNPEKLEKKNYRVKWNDLFGKTGIKIDVMNKAYGFFSMYVHSNFFSVAHLSELNRKESYKDKDFAILLSSFIICFTIDDLASKFKSGKEYIDKLDNKDYEIIRSFIISGRKSERNKNFAQYRV